MHSKPLSTQLTLFTPSLKQSRPNCHAVAICVQAHEICQTGSALKRHHEFYSVLALVSLHYLQLYVILLFDCRIVLDV